MIYSSSSNQTKYPTHVHEMKQGIDHNAITDEVNIIKLDEILATRAKNMLIIPYPE